ncbi:MAG TPA: UDP-glucuronic acid decarboxylase family protein [Terriglobia bacterium]|nr:UDP-glucuronic acid decarboxylase family protein [Terriglobia bacterium]
MSTSPHDNNLPRTLLIGGAGFLGSHFCDRLIGAGHEVICMDNLLTGTVGNVQHLLPHPRFTFVQHDVTQPIDLARLLGHRNDKFHLDSEGPFRLDHVVHMASPASPKDYARHPIHTLKIGALGTLHALGLAKAHGSVFLLTSTSEIYGDPQVCPQTETYWGHVNPIGPRSVYDEAKRYAESIAMAYHREHGLEVRIARIFNTYGKRMRLNDGRAIPNFVAQALQGKPLTIYGDGSQTRSFCYVSDLIEGLYKLMLSHEAAPVNLGNPHEIHLLELARTIIEATSSNSRLVFEPLPDDDPVRRCPDISKAKSSLHWRPKIGLHVGIKRVLPYFRARLMERCLDKTWPAGSARFLTHEARVAQNN